MFEIPVWVVLSLVNASEYVIGFTFLFIVSEKRKMKINDFSESLEFFTGIGLLGVGIFATYQWFVTGVAFQAGI